MTVLTRLWTAGDPIHEIGRRWLGKAIAGVLWGMNRGLWMLAGAGLVVVLGVPYVQRSFEESCHRVVNSEVDAVLLRHGVQRTETLTSYVERNIPLVAKGIMKPEDLAKEEGWFVCAAFLPSRSGH